MESLDNIFHSWHDNLSGFELGGSASGYGNLSLNIQGKHDGNGYGHGYDGGHAFSCGYSNYDGSGAGNSIFPGSGNKSCNGDG